MRVLLVEDNQRLNAALRARLEKDGYAVKTSEVQRTLGVLML